MNNNHDNAISEHIDIDVDSALENQHEEHELSTEEFIALLEAHSKTYIQKIKSTIATTNSLLLPFLFANAIPIFFQAKKEVEENLISNPYYLFSPKIKQALAYDLATANAEASALTTTLVLSSIAMLTFSIPYHIKKYYDVRKESNTLINTLNIKKYSDLMRIKMLSIKRDKLNELTAAIVQHGKTENLSAILDHPLSFYEKLEWYNTEVSKYINPITMLAFIPGFIVMYNATNDFKEDWQCDISPFLSYFSDKCKVLEQYSAMSAITYLWDIVSVTWLSLHTLATTARVLSIPFKTFREFIYKLHAPFEKWSNDKERWLYKDLIEEVVSRFLIFAAVYATYRAVNLVDRFALETNCETFPSFFTSLNSHNGNSDCTTAEKSMTVSGVIVILEFLTFYPLYISSKLLSSFFWAISEKCFKEPLISRETAKKMLQKFQSINSRNSAAAMIGTLIVGIPAFIMSREFEDNMLKEGLVKNIDLRGTTIPITIHEACPSYGAISLYFYNLLHKVVDCDPAFWRRAQSAFIAPYWLTVSVTAATFYLLSEGIFEFDALIKYCKNKINAITSTQDHEENNRNNLFSPKHNSRPALKLNLDEIENKKDIPLLEGEEDSPKHKSSYGCLSRIMNRFFKPAESKPKVTSDLTISYQP
ncbi:MAG: hypothetical protein P4M12_03810 [Gammaproteobacteria bacterium]|nr:hypothetical protein [Gammaproteobacteria bacterium]